MTANDLIATFETLADAPDGVKRLKELVVQLAVRGKLVEQRDGESVSAAPIRDELGTGLVTLEPPFELPATWAWSRLDQIAAYNGRDSVRPEDIPAEAWLLDLEDIEKTTSRLLRRATAAERASRSNKTSFKAGDVLYGKLRPYLDKVLVAEADGYCTTEIVPVVPGPTVTSGWLRLTLKRPDFLAYVSTLSYGVKMPRLGTQDANNSLHPLPPVAEQHRITARVDALMGLLDRLAAARTDCDRLRRAARDAALAALRDAENNDTVAVAWARLADTMSVMFVEPEDVVQLRQVVLGLAVRGRLTGDSDEDWANKTLADVLEDGPTNGWSPRSVEHPTGVLSLKLSATTRGYFDGSHSKHVEPEGEVDERLWLEPGDLLIQRSNTPEYVGTAAVFDGPARTYIYPDLMMRCRVSAEHDVRFVHLAISEPATRAWISAKASGTSKSMVKVNQATVASIPLRIPPLDRQLAIVAAASCYFALCDDLHAKLLAGLDLHERFAASAVNHLDV